VLKNNEQFFNSRYSIRDFKKSKVNINLIDKAVKLASKTPSVCNRQSWHVYHSSNKKVISKVLSFQSGNRGFAKLIPNLVIITTDLKSFLTGKEIYQQWIDGGLFSMSFIYAMHSIGVATCPLNWSQDPITDKNIRKSINIKTNQTIIMMIAIGHYKDNTTVCISSRLKNRKSWSEIKLKKNI
jgi:nitroreductase